MSAARALGGFNAQETSKLLYALGVSGVRCGALEAAAAQQRAVSFCFAPPVGDVCVQQMIGGTQRAFEVREETGAIAGNGGALFEDAFVLADWLARCPAPAAVDAAGMPAALRARGG